MKAVRLGHPISKVQISDISFTEDINDPFAKYEKDFQLAYIEPRPMSWKYIHQNFWFGLYDRLVMTHYFWTPRKLQKTLENPVKSELFFYVIDGSRLWMHVTDSQLADLCLQHALLTLLFAGITCAHIGNQRADPLIVSIVNWKSETICWNPHTQKRN